MDKLQPLAAGYAAALVAAAGMLLLSILGWGSMYTGAVQMMQGWHMMYSMTFLGILLGMIEAAVISFVFGYAFAILYNRFVR